MQKFDGDELIVVTGRDFNAMLALADSLGYYRGLPESTDYDPNSRTATRELENRIAFEYGYLITEIQQDSTDYKAKKVYGE